MRTAIRRYMVLILLCIVRVPSVPAAISVSIPNMSGMQGSTVDIPVVVAGMLPSDSLVAYQMKIQFNATVLQISSATQNGTMTANWGSPFTSIKNDTVRIGGYTTNQPNKRIVQDDNILVKLRVLVIGYPGSQSSITISEIKFFHLTGEMQISGVTGGTFSVTQNPGAQDVDLNLYPSWNLISFPVVPTLGTLPEILQSLPVEQVMGYYPPEGYKTWALNRPINSLKNMDGLHGFWMRLNSQTNRILRISGAPIAVNSPIFLYSDWNLISYLPPLPDLISHSLASIDPLYLQIMGYEGGTGGGYKTWARNRPINSLGGLAPTYGYWIKMSGEATLEYPASGYMLSKAQRGFPIVNRGEQNLTMVPTACDFWAKQAGLYSIGDSVDVYDSKNKWLCRTYVIEKDMFLATVPGDDSTTLEKEGAFEGEELSFRINGDSTTVTGTSLNNVDTVIVPGRKAIWQNMGNIRVELKRITNNAPNGRTHNGLPPESGWWIRNYPNPFNSTTVVDYQIKCREEVTLRVYDVRGRLVRTLLKNKPQEAGSHSVLWDARNDRGEPLPSGVYVCRMTAGRAWASIKLILLY